MSIRQQLLGIDLVRHSLVRLRLFYLVRIRRRLRTFDSPFSSSGTLEHNLRAIGGISDRAKSLFSAANLIENVAAGKTLIIGCRNEDDLFVAESLGFRDVIGLDLISYSSKVVLGDLHDLPFEDAKFQTVLIPYTLSYSADIRTAASEIVRVTQPGGVIGIAVEYLAEGLTAQSFGGFIAEGDGYYLRSTQAFLDLFRENIGQVIVSYDALAKRSHSEETLIQNPSPVITVFTVRKD